MAHKYTIHKVQTPLPGWSEWRIQCVCGWREKARTFREASDRGKHHCKYPGITRV